MACLYQQGGHGKLIVDLDCVLVLTFGRLCPVDAILTRMGAYDNMFSNASTFKVELDEWYVPSIILMAGSLISYCSCKILRDATPKSFVILDELGRDLGATGTKHIVLRGSIWAVTYKHG